MIREVAMEARTRRNPSPPLPHRCLPWIVLLMFFLPTSAAAAVQIFELTPQSGPVGTSVRLSGAGFDPALISDASIGGVSCPITAKDASGVTVVIPSGAATGRISVTQDGFFQIVNRSKDYRDEVNPILINGVASESARIADGDVIKLGTGNYGFPRGKAG